MFHNIWPLTGPNIAKKGGVLQKWARGDWQTHFGTCNFGNSFASAPAATFPAFVPLFFQAVYLHCPSFFAGYRAWAPGGAGPRPGPGPGWGLRRRMESCVFSKQLFKPLTSPKGAKSTMLYIL